MNDLLTKPNLDADAPQEARAPEDIAPDLTFEFSEVGTSGFFPHVDPGDDSEA